MDLGTPPLFDLPAAPAAGTLEEPSAQVPLSRGDQLLKDIKDNRASINDRLLGEVEMIAAWALEHTVAVPEDASTLTERGLDTGLPLAGVGAPLISDFAVLELGATLARGIDSTRRYVGQVVELSHRLPLVWARVLGGLVPVWKALRVAECTHDLSTDAVEFVDRHLARFAATCTWAQVERLIEEAMTRFDPDLAEQRRTDAAEHRRFDVDLDRAGTEGTVPVHGELDLADALDLEHAVRAGARELAELGCEESLDVRRSMTLGEMARRDLTLNLVSEDQEAPTPLRPHTPRGRTVDLTVHLSQAAVEGKHPDGTDPDGVVGRLANTRTPVTAEQIRDWCQAAGTIIVRPVLDVAGHQPTGAYEIAERQARQVLLRDQACVFPSCTRPAEGCDLDHVIPHAAGGVTCPCNLAPVCRGHHRLKTHHGWSYRVLAPGVYDWRSRTGQQWLVTPGGTYTLDGQHCGGLDTPSPSGSGYSTNLGNCSTDLGHSSADPGSCSTDLGHCSTDLGNCSTHLESADPPDE